VLALQNVCKINAYFLSVGKKSLTAIFPLVSMFKQFSTGQYKILFRSKYVVSIIVPDL
jgi:hypothetical protein